MTEDEIVGWYHQLNGCEFEQTLRDSGRQRRLACCSPWGHRVRHDLVTEQQKDLNIHFSKEDTEMAEEADEKIFNITNH